MTASINPDDHSYASKDADSRERQGFVYDDSNAPPAEPEPIYVPEREFVLMPLFRRIGDLLGIRRREQPEYIYEAAQEITSPEANRAHEEAKAAIDNTAHREPEAAGTSQAEPEHRPMQEWAQLEPTGLPEAIPAIPEPLPLRTTAIHQTPESSLIQEFEENNVTHTHTEQPSSTPEPLQVVEAKPVQASAEILEEIAVPTSHHAQFEHEPAAEPIAPQTPADLHEVVAAHSTNQAQHQRRRPAPRSQDEIDEAIAVLREAGSKVSTAISQAVEWLGAKEQELVRKAERSLAPAPKTKRLQSSAAAPTVAKPQSWDSQSGAQPASTRSTSETSPEVSSVPKWETLQFSGLQREVSWTGQVAPAPAGRRSINLQPAAQAGPSAKRGPALVKPRPRVPFWKRIDWAAEFTPIRVAVLGGVIMAMLIVAGITFARRPASEVLPPQPRTIQPGGVTVTTHPTSPAITAPAQQSRRTAPPAKRSVAPAPGRAARTVDPDEPDVVTHYYKEKPSPSKQATVAGVKHYSDMN